MYYVLGTDGRENVYMKKERGLNSHIELAMGRLWDVTTDEIDLPYRYNMKVIEGQTPRLYGFYPGSDLMQQRLVDLLQSVGVDNLQTFPTVVTRDITGEEIPGYVTVNIVGRVACAVMDKPNTSPLANVLYFHELVINPVKAQGLLMFRLHESPMLILVNESVADAILSSDFPGLTLEAVSEYLET
jgi:hypothetical protein